MQRINLHATALVLGSRGVLVFGPSGAGKSSLALHLIALFQARGAFARLVADDRTWVSVHGGRLVAGVPDTIAGLVEIRGFGPAPLACEPRAVIDRVVALVEPNRAPRHREDARETVMGVPLPRLDVAAGDEASAARAVAAWLAPPAPAPTHF